MDDLANRFPNLPERLAGLGELAFNLWWSWHPAAWVLFQRLDRLAWTETDHNPVKLLKMLSRSSLETAAADPVYLRRYDAVMSEFHRKIQNQVCWFTENVTAAQCYPIAYFSLEYGLHRSLPFYAGGLGFLAGDHLKECSDLGIPMVAVGFMYPEGYVRQRINADGWQEDVDELLDRDAAPITRVFDAQGKRLVVQVPFTDPPIHVEVWQVMVGRIPLYLMDTDLEINDPAHRRISNHLYISDQEQRLLQEIVLGVGGSEMLAQMGIKHSVLHMNEGHPAFALLERIRERVEDGMDFDEAHAAGAGYLGLHHPYPGARGPRRLSLRPDRQIHLRLLPHVHPGPGRLSQIGDLPHGRSRRRFQHDRFRLAALPISQRRQPQARRGLPPHVAAPVARPAVGASSH